MEAFMHGGMLARRRWPQSGDPGYRSQRRATRLQAIFARTQMSPGNKKRSLAVVSVAASLVAGIAVTADMPAIAHAPPVKDDGTITVPSFDLPFSSFASREARDALVQRLRNPMPMVADIAKTRSMMDERMAPVLERAKSLYPYTVSKSTMGGVPVQTYVPTAGIAPQNKDRVLIELHGGAFVVGGGGPGGASESIPIAGVGHIKVVAVDYRLGPENHFPAASEDVAAVYRELLKTYKPQNVGIYGCSAGGMLSAETIPWFLKEKLPLPGAIGVFCASLYTFGEGDSAQIQPRLGSVIPIIPPTVPQDNFGASTAYFGGASSKDPLAVPGASKQVMKAFPPTLFLTGTRAPDMSAAAQSHLKLKQLGVKSELLLFDGMDHGFYADPTLPESVTAYELIAAFFAENLGVKRGKDVKVASR
jgi:monoterpene epsilon-lactone hydrolase